MTRPSPLRALVATWVAVGALGCLALAAAAPASASPSAASVSSAASAASASSAAAWGWVLSQLGSGTTVTSGSTIAPDREYPAAWTGPLGGSFTLRGRPTPPVVAATPVVVTSPAPLSGGYRGLVAGRVTVAPTPGRWIVNVVRLTATGPAQAGLQTLVAPDGTFTLDLAAAGPVPPGEWGLQLLDANHGYRQEGATWPHPGILDGLVVRALVVTDTTYPVDEVPARADGTFAFDSSRPGAKVFQLVDAGDGSVLAEAAPDTGLVRSYDVPATDPSAGRSFTYDQALALVTADSLGDEGAAATLVRGLLALQTRGGSQDGGFVSSAAALAPAYALPEYRTGNHAVATYALLRHLRSLPADDPRRPALVDAGVRAVGWLLDRQRTAGTFDGLVTGGRGATRPDGGFDADVELPWAGAEHNLDAWHTLSLAARVLTGQAATASGAAATRLEAAVATRLWDPTVGRFLQGLQPEGPDPTPMLDLASWGALWLERTGRDDLAGTSLDGADTFATTDAGVAGWAPRPPSAAGGPVWFEGSAGVALAAHRLGRPDASARLSALSAGQRGDGSWPEATRDDEAMGMGRHPAVAATTWMLLARQGQAGLPTIWDE
ncbi:hypothetical protein DFJ68_3235 [Terracoccus luteus]|uniref:Uncharacterized protein n=1 Tax=Terracoccus luteus TaxID=53356 RepID=A0A495XZN0_9MICO|nr:hypothetical protein [Terracoccus luteus]RKT79757.1 hypothetical protein DFJ68_3235 [Terracoccus luteus]